MKYTLFQKLLPSNEAQLLRRIFADLEYLGVIPKYNSYCLFMSSLVSEILKEHQFDVELRACVAVIDQGPHKRFLLGAKEYAAPGQIPSHLVCVVNQTILLDFGLGNVRRQFAPNFFCGLILPLQNYHASKGQVLCSTQIDHQHEIYYVADDMPDCLQRDLEAQSELLQKTLMDYRRYTKNRLRFNLTRLLKKVYRTHPFTSKGHPDLKRMVGDFDATLSQ